LDALQHVGIVYNKDRCAPGSSIAGFRCTPKKGTAIHWKETGMATGTTDLQSAPPAADPQFDDVVERQIREARLHVKLADLAATLMVWFAGLIVFLLVTAVIDSYVFDLGVAGRITALVVLIAASVWYFVATLSPMVLGRLNPVYVARVIEESQPSLKNSLMNFLLLRGDPRGVHHAIFSALRMQAATAVSQVNVSAAVDRSKVIKTGYVLAASVAVFAIYTVLQPNPLAPLDTMRRIFAPLAAIDRPTRVQITNIQPGNSSVFRGDNPAVSAVVHHLDEQQPVTLFYTTADGQTVDQPVEMLLHKKSGEHRAELDASGEGLQQSVTYRIEAGDAVSAAFEISVIDRPAIWIRAVDYDYAPQTRLKNRTEAPPANGGDITGVEGTRVKIQATANMDIATAYLEFDPQPGRPPRKLPMQHKGREAWVTLPLQMNAKRDGPMYGSYRVRFTTGEGKRNETKEAPHQIQVTPDLAPEIEILHPVDDPFKLKLNRGVEIEVRAVDADFGLRQVILEAQLVRRDGAVLSPALDSRAAAGGILKKILLNHAAGISGKQIHTLRFVPAELGLQAGDLVRCRAIALDNRTDAVSRSLQPNRTSTANFHIQIVAAPKGSSTDDKTKGDASGGTTPSDTASADKHDDKTNDGDKPDGGESDPAEADSGKIDDGGKKPGDEEKSNAEESPSKASDEAPEMGDSGENADDSAGSESGDTTGGESSDGASDSKSGGGKQGSDGAAGGSQDGGDAGDASNPGSESAGDGGGDSGAGKAQDGGSTQEGGADGSDTGESTGQPSDGRSTAKPGKGQPGGKPGDSAGSQEPLHDGDVFERALEHMKQQAQQQENAGSAGDNTQGAGDNTQGASDKPQGAGDNPQGAGDKPQGAGDNPHV